ncbi:MAG: hypothetical protein NT157_01890 [Candidatus Micrarchaeota archaeon]|nr:hypothetical protein [Candidatus Micrarchaeota archaeon]
MGLVFPKLACLTDLDRMRRKRHIATYDEAGTITEFEARHALKTAKEFLSLVKSSLKISE